MGGTLRRCKYPIPCSFTSIDDSCLLLLWRLPSAGFLFFSFKKKFPWLIYIYNWNLVPLTHFTHFCFFNSIFPSTFISWYYTKKGLSFHPTYSFIHSFISSSNKKFSRIVFCHYLFWSSSCLGFDCWLSFQACFFFLNTSLQFGALICFLTQQDVAGSYCPFLLSRELAMSPRSLVLFTGEWCLEPACRLSCAHCSWPPLSSMCLLSGWVLQHTQEILA